MKSATVGWFIMAPPSGSNSVVECDLAKVEVAGSNPVSRSRFRSQVQPTLVRCASLVVRRTSMPSRIALVGAVAMLVIIGLGCGSHLNSVSLSPAVADAQNFANGQVQFSATGSYGGSPKPVPATTLTWCIGTTNGDCNGNIASVASVSSSGLAQCLPGASGTATVLAGSGGQPTNPDGSFPLRVFGSAQLTCP